MACSVIVILFSKLRVFAGVWAVPVQQKTPRAGRQARGARRVRSTGPVVGTASADALSKYENSGAHGIDPPSDAPPLSSGWDWRLNI
ncbi:hypothetical protein E4P36_32490 [Streptomyces sp. 4R-3d]|nr:hypothetical protein E4P36_32490 [Streptomyces sp. 4R-3d]